MKNHRLQEFELLELLWCVSGVTLLSWKITRGLSSKCYHCQIYRYALPLCSSPNISLSLSVCPSVFSCCSKNYLRKKIKTEEKINPLTKRKRKRYDDKSKNIRLRVLSCYNSNYKQQRHWPSSSSVYCINIKQGSKTSDYKVLDWVVDKVFVYFWPLLSLLSRSYL